MALRSILGVSSIRSAVSTYCCRKVMYSTEYKNRFYTKKHEWVSVNNNIGTIGISSFAQDALGEVVFAQLPDVGKVLAAGDECGALESVKAAGEVYTPVSGTAGLISKMIPFLSRSDKYLQRYDDKCLKLAAETESRGVEVTEKNDSVESSPSLINKSCYEEGWLFKVKLASPEELQQLMDQTTYDKYLEEAH